MVLVSLSTEKNSSKPAISGTVKDVSGGVVPKVRIALRDLKDNSIQKITSFDEGKYRFSNLKSSVYRINFEADGFQIKTILLNLKKGNETKEKLNLEVGAMIGEIVIINP